MTRNFANRSGRRVAHEEKERNLWSMGLAYDWGKSGVNWNYLPLPDFEVCCSLRVFYRFVQFKCFILVFLEEFHFENQYTDIVSSAENIAAQNIYQVIFSKIERQRCYFFLNCKSSIGLDPMKLEKRCDSPEAVLLLALDMFKWSFSNNKKIATGNTTFLKF